jgi:hypothetical protein
MNKIFTSLFLIILSIFSYSQNTYINKLATPLTCSPTVVGYTNPTGSGLCNGTLTVNLSSCSNPPYDIQWFNPTCSPLPSAISQYVVLITNALGEQSVLSVSFSDPMPTSINEIANENFISISPNPANDLLSINLKLANISNPRFELINSFGQIVISSSLLKDNLQLIDIQSLSKGIYFIKIYSTDKQVFTKKLILQ